MARNWKRDFYVTEVVEFFNHLMGERPLFSFLLLLVLLAWAVERWVLPFSNWATIAVTIWATLQYGSYQKWLFVEDLNKRWKQTILKTLPMTPLEHCEWLNKLLMEIWSNFINPKLSKMFSSVVEKQLKHRRPRLIEKIELKEFSLGLLPPSFGLHGTHWSTSGDELLLMPVLDGKAVLYSFESTPEVRIGVAFGGSGNQRLSGTELPGVSSWLVNLFTKMLVKTMVEPRRRCYSLPSVDLWKRAVGGLLSVTIVSVNKLVGNNIKASTSRSKQNSMRNGNLEENPDNKVLQTFVEVELEQLIRRTDKSPGSCPRWDATFNMVLHEDSGTLRFLLYECTPRSLKYDYLSSCEIKMKYVADDSTIFWAIGSGTSVLARHVESCGKEVEMVLPFEGPNIGELTVKLMLKEWQFSNGSNILNNSLHASSRESLCGSSGIQSRTGRKLNIIVVEGNNLIGKDKSGKCSPYVKLQYGKVFHRTRTIHHPMNPIWNHKFEFDEIGNGEYLKIKCYSEGPFGYDNIGTARVNLEGLVEGSLRDVWIPLEKAKSGELRLQIEAVRNDDYDRSRSVMAGLGNGWIELVLIEARDLIAADLRGTSDPYVKIQYGSLKKRTKVIYKTLSPQWNQTLKFPDDGSPLVLHVKDHNTVLPRSSIGDCVVEYQGLPPNQMADKWIPLQGVKRGEIHIQITRRIPELQKKSSLDSENPSLSRAYQISAQIRQTMAKVQALLKEGDLERLSLALCEVENLEDVKHEYMLQLETEKTLLLNKINEFGREIYKCSPSLTRKMYGS
ncbi:PREDICTED: extended synaptotagmin-1-like isoform X2 [Nelumbo nucifera]|uniref:Extended synaptotagmin-1-like isoform X2 n=1 Tax=Nelumbo nucifera TaxID=4432 RepID=A0A1U8A9E4_NELNU|nr:PREDICTED: extended synaptotagmin-1-like isoform X2 [Nelumbo nucifera]